MSGFRKLAGRCLAPGFIGGALAIVGVRFFLTCFEGCGRLWWSDLKRVIDTSRFADRSLPQLGLLPHHTAQQSSDVLLVRAAPRGYTS